MRKPEKPPKPGDKEMQEFFENMPKYFANEDIQKYVKYVNDQYFSWEETKRRPVPKSVSKENFWYMVKFLRNMSSMHLKQFTPLTFSYNYNSSNIIQKKLHEIDMNCGSVLVSSQIVPREDEKMYLLSSIMEEAIASSQLEGATTSRQVAKEMLKTKRSPTNNAERMILNNYITMNRVIEMKEEKLTPEMIKMLQGTITENTLENKEWEGKFRDNDNVRVHDRITGEVFHTPPKAEDLEKMVKIYCDYANQPDDDPYVHPIIKASILHFLFGYIHPFEDGNGRTARTIFYWYLISRGYWLFRYMSISRVILNAPAKYARAYLFTEQDENDMTYFIKFQIRCIELAYKDLLTYIAHKQDEKKKIYSYLQNIEEINERQAYVLSLFSKNPHRMVVISEIQENFKVVYQTARNDLFDLENKKFLIKKKIGKSFKFFKSEDFDNLILGIEKNNQKE